MKYKLSENLVIAIIISSVFSRETEILSQPNVEIKSRIITKQTIEITSYRLNNVIFLLYTRCHCNKCFLMLIVFLSTLIFLPHTCFVTTFCEYLIFQGISKITDAIGNFSSKFSKANCGFHSG